MRVDDKISVQQEAEIASPLDIFAELDKMPSLVVIHSVGGNSMKPVRAFANQAHHSHCTGIVIGLQLKASHLVEKTIQLLPHLRADLLANLPGIFAGAADAFHNRKSPFRIRYQQEQSTLRVDVASSRTGGERGNGAKPTLFRGKLCRIQNQAVSRLHHSRGIVRPLEIAAHPVETVGDAGKHGVLSPNSSKSQFCRTHVSFEPPPCDELTTSEPFRSATRVRPPGIMVIFSP